MDLGNFETAEKFLQEILAIASTNGDREHIIAALLVLDILSNKRSELELVTSCNSFIALCFESYPNAIPLLLSRNAKPAYCSMRDFRRNK